MFKTFLILFSISGLFSLYIFSSIQPVFAQTQVEILRPVDRLVGADSPLGPVRKLIGNVELRTENLHIIADSAYQYLEVDLIEAFGNIQIETERQLIWADRVRYNLTQDASHFTGRVIVKTRESTIYSEELFYDFIFEIAEFPQLVRFEDENGILTANSGIYFSLTDSSSFHGNVQLFDATQYAEADSLIAIRSIDFAELRGNVYLEDLENNASITGDFSRSDSTGFREVIGNARLQRINDAQTDTTHLSAHRVVFLETDTSNVVNAYDQVSIWSKNYAALSDSSQFDDTNDLFYLFGNARLWQKELQLSSSEIEITIESDEIDQLLSTGGSCFVLPDSITSRFNQIEGDSLLMYFFEGDISNLEVFPNAEMVVHNKDEDDNPEDAIRLSARKIIMYFSEGDIDSMRVLQSIDGQFIPEAQNPSEIRLEGFIYEPENKPQRPLFWLRPRLGPISEDFPFDLPRRFIQYMEENQPTND